MVPDRCSICGLPFSHQWCQKCEADNFKRKSCRWSSAVDNFSYLEWIPFENFDEVEFQTRGVFSVVYSGVWFEGPRQKWDDKDGIWLKIGLTKCALRRVENFDQTMSQEYLNNVRNYVVDCFGITRDPNDPPGCYIDIAIILRRIIDGLKRIHDNGLYHDNLHCENLLIDEGVDIRISDIG
ncbi:40319_t:CDS:2, partial [Gigaspora margarita]